MKHLVITFFVLSAIAMHAQWPQFNRAHPVSCQLPAYNYQAHGFFENVFVVDTIPSVYDGYVAFGRGNICHPDSVVNYSRNFSAQFNIGGDLMWWSRYDSPDFDLLETWFGGNSFGRGGMIQNHNGNIISTFSTLQENGQNDLVIDNLIQMDLFGNIIEQFVLDSSSARFAFHGLTQDLSDTTYLAYGSRMSTSDVINNVEPDAFLLKLDTLGNHIWLKEYSSTFGVWPGGVVKALDGGFWVCVNSTALGDCPDGFFVNSDFVLIKTDEFGNEEDRIIFGGSCGNEMGTVHEYEEDKVMLVGRLTNVENDPNGMYAGFYYSNTIEQQPNGEMIVTTIPKTYLPTNNGNFIDLHIVPNQGYLIVCDNQLSPEQGSGSQWRWKGGLLMLDSNRDSLWFRSYSYYNNFPATTTQFPARHFILDSKPTPDGGWVCCGYIDQQSADPNPFLLTPWLFKVDSLGCLEPGCHLVNVEEITIGLENTLSAYPNPTSGQVNITFALPPGFRDTQTELIVVDLTGREVHREALSAFALTSGTLQLDFTGQPAGVYLTQWVSGNTWLDSVRVVRE